MKRFAIIMLALIAINSAIALIGVEAKSTRTTKIVQTVKRKKINRTLVRKRLISYGKRKGMKFDSKLTVKNLSWFPPTNIKYYRNNSKLISAGKGDIRYLLASFSDCEPSDITFNVKLVGRYLYILYFLLIYLLL